MSARALTSITAATAAAAAAVLLAGCGVSNPSPLTTPTRHPQGLRTPTTVVAAQRDPLARLAIDYALTQATWSADTYVAQRGRLAQLATGRARAQLTPRDGQSPVSVAARLRAAGASSTASLLGSDGPDAKQRVVVAYKTVATGTGHTIGAADYQIAHVTLARQHGRLLISDFAIAP